MNIPKDKLLHAAAGAAISVLIGLVTQTPWLGAMAALVAAIGKEWYDRNHRGHTVDVADAAVTIGAGAAAAGVLTVLM